MTQPHPGILIKIWQTFFMITLSGMILLSYSGVSAQTNSDSSSSGSVESGDSFLDDPVEEDDDSFLDDPVEEENGDSFLDDPVEEDVSSDAPPELGTTADLSTSGGLDPIKIEQSYSIKAETIEVNRGFSLGDNPAEEESDTLYNTYQVKADLKVSPHWSFHLDLTIEHDYTRDKLTEKEKGTVNGTLTSAHVRFRKGTHLLTIGEQEFKIGTLDSSPMDILEQSGDRDYLEWIPNVYYRWGAHPFSLHLYWNPIYQATEAQQEAIDSNDVEDKRSEMRSYGGIRIGWSLDNADVKLGAFKWFDRDSQLTSQHYLTPPQTTDGTVAKTTVLFEEESEVRFYTFEMDWSFSDYVWRIELINFQDKNVYDFKVLSDEEIAIALQTIPPLPKVVAAEVNTLALDQVVFASTLERIVEDLIIMPGVIVRRIKDVPNDTLIAYYENEKNPETKSRDVERTDVSLLVKYDFSDELNTSFKMIKTTPFEQDLISNEWNWKSWKFKVTRSDSEKLFVTNQKLKNDSTFISYKHEF